ncbi:PAAR domain-containing protein [Pseudomonas coronafaciens pv. zizaniae]|nr:PAAR domain-containing protein [Pseudomonas coronafaciens pv. zizaniae]
MISSARLGDKHACPLPGHGTNPIASASGDVNINSMGAACVGDTCGCGAVITSGFPSIQVNGRPMAHLGSPTSHGGTIITGSSNVGGGFVMGDAGGATIINFMALGAFRPDGSVDDEKMATFLADPKLEEKALAANALVNPNAAREKPEEEAVPNDGPEGCTHPNMMEKLATYIADEINNNIHHSSVL